MDGAVVVYEVQVSIHNKRLRFLGHADKGALNKSCRPTQPDIATEEHRTAAYEAGGEGDLPSRVNDSEGQKQKHTEALSTHDGTTEFEELQDSYMQSADLHTASEAGGEGVLPSSVSDSEGEKQEHAEALPTHDGMTEDKMEEDREERTHGGFPEYEVPLHSFVQVVEPPPSYKAPVEAEGSENIMASNYLPLYKEATSSHTETLEDEISPSAYERGERTTRREEAQNDHSSFEAFEKGIQAGEPSYSSPEGSAEWRKKAFAKETQEDSELQNDRPAKELVDSFEAEWPVETEQGRPCDTSSGAAPLPNVGVHGGIEFQEEEQKILADINAIKKIVGYQGEPDAPIMEQISAMYMFLGMEPYYWATEVEYFERAQAEIELLKVVVGVK